MFSLNIISLIDVKLHGLLRINADDLNTLIFDIVIITFFTFLRH